MTTGPALAALPHLVLTGAVAGTAALLVVAGTTKALRFRRSPDGDAIQLALRVGPGRWRWVGLATGALELLTGVAALLGQRPVVTGVAMALQGAGFSLLLAYVRHAKVVGDCGCVLPGHKGRVTWPAQARAAFVLGAGVAEAVAGLTMPAPVSWPGAVVGGIGAAVLLVLVGADRPWRTPVCHRRLWRPMRDTVEQLKGHQVFQELVPGPRPASETFGYRRSGCVEEFWFVPAAGPVVLFRVSRPAPTRALAIHASTVEAPPPSVHIGR